MRRININNKSEVKLFRAEIDGYFWVSESAIIIPYHREDSTNKGANYRMYVPLMWKERLSPSHLRSSLRNEVDADKITIEYIDFFKGKTE